MEGSSRPSYGSNSYGNQQKPGGDSHRLRRYRRSMVRIGWTTTSTMLKAKSGSDTVSPWDGHRSPRASLSLPRKREVFVRPISGTGLPLTLSYRELPHIFIPVICPSWHFHISILTTLVNSLLRSQDKVLKLDARRFLSHDEGIGMKSWLWHHDVDDEAKDYTGILVHMIFGPAHAIQMQFQLLGTQLHLRLQSKFRDVGWPFYDCETGWAESWGRDKCICPGTCHAWIVDLEVVGYIKIE